MSVVGIDLGTTNTVVACVRSGKASVLADEHGERLLPSVVSFPPNGEVLVGSAARARRTTDPKNTIHSHKRLIGRSWGSPELTEARSRLAFDLREGPGHSPLIRAQGHDYTLPEISAFVLKRARQLAETALGSSIERAVITVPAHFNELQRASTKVAGRVSGLEILRILNEPTAAALAYGLGRAGHERVAVYDFGGGTFDCTLLDLNGSVFEVLATAGDPFLGGDDIDDRIAERMAEACGRNVHGNSQILERLKTAAETIKIALSTAEAHTIALEELGQGLARPFTFTMTRADLDALVTPLIDRSFKITQDALALSGLSPTSLDKIILVGGSTRMPLVRDRVKAFFGRAPLDRVNPDEVVAIGAAIQAAALTTAPRKRTIPPPPSAFRRPSSPADTTEVRPPQPSVPPGRTGAGNTNPAFPFPPPPRSASGSADPAFAPPSKSSPPAGGTNPSYSYRPASAPPPSSHGGTAPNIRARLTPTSAKATHRGVAPPSNVASMDPSSTTGLPISTSFGTIEEPPTLATLATSSPSTRAAEARSDDDHADTLSKRTPPPPEVEPFGVLQDLSLGTASVGPSSASAEHGRSTSPSVDVSFGHLPDLSLPSTSASSIAEPDHVHAARQKLLEEFDAETAASLRRSVEAGDFSDFGVTDEIDLPSLSRHSDLPAVAKGRPSSKPGHGSGRPQVTPPPLFGVPAPADSVRPQPFGPMEKIHREEAAPRTVVMPGAPQGAGHTAPMNRPTNLGIAPPYPSIPPPAASDTARFGSLGGGPASPLEVTASNTFGTAPGGPQFHSVPPGYGSAPPHAAISPTDFVAPVLVDVTPRGLVVETAGGYADAIIPRNAKIPCERTRRFATGRDGQMTVRIRVGQGEHNVFAQNTFLGEVALEGLRPAVRGEVLIAVTFEVDADGTLRVRARDVQTGQEARATLQLIGIADESSVVMMINRLAQQPGLPPHGSRGPTGG